MKIAFDSLLNFQNNFNWDMALLAIYTQYKLLKAIATVKLEVFEEYLPRVEYSRDTHRG